MSYFDFIGKIQYEGAKTKNPFAFKFYNPDQKVLGKTMRQHLPFSMAWWHNLCGEGGDIFGNSTINKSFGAKKGTMEHSFSKVDAGFEFMQKLGIDYFCFHDVDLIPEIANFAENNRRLDEISDYILKKMQETGIKCLWGTANMFSNPRFMNGAGSSNSADVYCCAAAQIKKALDLTVKLGGKGYVFWGGREGYDTLLNTDIKFELDNIAYLMKMSVEYGRSIGFNGDFYIEPKPKEPMKHQYDFDAATAIGFLRNYGLDKDFKLNIEANHATLAGHSFQHELRTAAINGMLGSIDINQGDLLLGWDTDEFPANVYESTLCMYEVLRVGELSGGLNFDAKTRRSSNTLEDMVEAYILGMDTFALGLINAAKLIEDGRIDDFAEKRYSSFSEGIGLRIREKDVKLQELADYAQRLNLVDSPSSGKQESLESIVNAILFG